MRRTPKNIAFVSLFLWLLIIFNGYADTPTPKSITRIDTYLQESAEYGLSGAVLIA